MCYRVIYCCRIQYSISNNSISSHFQVRLFGEPRVKRLTVFVKGNVDVHDSLHSCRMGGKLLWNGLNAALRPRYPATTARVRHETWARSDALLASEGFVPDAIAARDLKLGAYPAASQFSRALLETTADVVILSIQPDIATAMVRHTQDGFLFYPNDSQHWSSDDRQWLKSEFTATGPLALETSMANLETIVAAIRRHRDVPILIYNVSPIVPGEMIHCHLGLDETFSNRIRRFNLGLADLSRRTGVSIIDIDTLVARHGADVMKIDAVHLTPKAYRLVAEEVVRVLYDIGVLEDIQQGVPA
jgi:hypothetical protein